MGEKQTDDQGRWRQFIMGTMLWEGLRKEAYVQCWEGTEGKSRRPGLVSTSILYLYPALSLAETFEEEESRHEINLKIKFVVVVAVWKAF